MIPQVPQSLRCHKGEFTDPYLRPHFQCVPVTPIVFIPSTSAGSPTLNTSGHVQPVSPSAKSAQRDPNAVTIFANGACMKQHTLFNRPNPTTGNRVLKHCVTHTFTLVRLSFAGAGRRSVGDDPKARSSVSGARPGSRAGKRPASSASVGPPTGGVDDDDESVGEVSLCRG